MSKKVLHPPIRPNGEFEAESPAKPGFTPS